MRNWGRATRCRAACFVLLLGIAGDVVGGSSDSDTDDYTETTGLQGALGVAMQCVFTVGNQTSCMLEVEALISQLAVLVSSPSQFESQFPHTDSDLITQMCAPGSCFPTLNTNAVDTYAGLLAAQGSDDTCGPTSQLGEAAGTMVGLLGLVTDFLCLASADGVPCFTAIVEAIQDAGMTGILTGHATVDTSNQMAELMALSKGCTAFATAGCCAQSFFDTITAYQQLTCVNSTKETELLMLLPKTCGAMPGVGTGPLESACPGYSAQDHVQYAPANCPPRSSAGEYWEEIIGTCGASPNVSTSGCPTDMCKFGCLAVASLLEAEGPILESNTILSVGSEVAVSGFGLGTLFTGGVCSMLVLILATGLFAKLGRNTKHKTSIIHSAIPNYGAVDEQGPRI